MKRQDLIQAKLDDKQKVDFTEIHEDDKRSMKRLISEEEENLYEVEKKIKRYQENPTLTIGSEFVALIESKKAIDTRIALLKEVQGKYV